MYHIIIVYFIVMIFTSVNAMEHNESHQKRLKCRFKRVQSNDYHKISIPEDIRDLIHIAKPQDLEPGDEIVYAFKKLMKYSPKINAPAKTIKALFAFVQKHHEKLRMFTHDLRHRTYKEWLDFVDSISPELMRDVLCFPTNRPDERNIDKALDKLGLHVVKSLIKAKFWGKTVVDFCRYHPEMKDVKRVIMSDVLQSCELNCLIAYVLNVVPIACLKNVKIPRVNYTDRVLSPNKKQVAMSKNDTIVILDVIVDNNKATPTKLVHTLECAHNVSTISWSPDGTKLASSLHNECMEPLWGLSTVSFDTIKIWDMNSGECIQTFSQQNLFDPINSISWSSDGKYIALGFWIGNIQIWDATTGDFIKKIEGDEHDNQFVAWSPQGNRIAAVGGHNKMINMWDVDSGLCIRRWKERKDSPIFLNDEYIFAIRWSDDGKTLACASDQRTKVWDLDLSNRVENYLRNGLNLHEIMLLQKIQPILMLYSVIKSYTSDFEKYHLTMESQLIFNELGNGDQEVRDFLRRKIKSPYIIEYGK